MALNPAFISTPRLAIATVSTANQAFDGTGTITNLIQGAASGTRILQIDAQAATSTTVPYLINVFISLNNGSPGTWRLFDSYPMAAAAASASAPPTKYTEVYTNLILPNQSAWLGVTTTVGGGNGLPLPINVIAFGGDF